MRPRVLTANRQDREDFTPYRFRIHIPGKDVIIDQYPTDLLGLLQKHGVSNPFEYVSRNSVHCVMAPLG